MTIKTDALTGISIVPVDPTRSFVIFQTRHAGARPVDSEIRARLNDNGTVVEFTRVTNSNTIVTVDLRFYVLEFSNGVRVQRGVAKQTGATTTIALNPPVVPDRSFALWSKTPDPSNMTFDSNDPVVAWLKDARTLELQLNGSVASQFAVAWQVVEFTNGEDMSVARNLTRIQGGQTQTVVPLPRAYDLSRSLVLADFLSASQGPAGVGGQLITARPTSPTTLLFSRGARVGFEVPRIGWQIMELGQSARVEAGSLTLAPGEFNKRVKLGRTPIPEFSVAMSSVQSGGGQNTGATPYVADDVVGVCAVTMTFNGGELVVERSSVVDSCTVYHQVAQWPEAVVCPGLGKVEGPGCI